MFGVSQLRVRITLWLLAIGSMLPIGGSTDKAFGDVVVGIVQDSSGKPVSNVSVRVYASRPTKSAPTVVSFLHPDCQLVSESDEQGRFEMKGITDGHEVMLLVWKKGHLISRSGYVTASTESIVVTIRDLAESNLPGRIEGDLSDANNHPIANAVVGYDDAYASPKPIAVLTDAAGHFSLPSEENSYPVSLTAMIPNVGRRELRLHSGTQIAKQTSWTILPSVTVIGRIIDEQGSVPNYNVCVSNASNYGPTTMLTVATDSDGHFSIGGVPEGPDGLGRELEYCLYGDIAQRNNRGHLATKRFDAGNNGEVLDFGDLRLGPVTNMTLRLELNGGKIESDRATVSLSLRQQSKPLIIPISADGLAKFENIPCEPLQFRIDRTHPFSYSKSNRLQPSFMDDAFYFNPQGTTELVIQME